MNNKVIFWDNLECLQTFNDEMFELVYIDPPFNTNKIQKRTTLKMEKSEEGDRVGYGGEKYKSEKVSEMSYSDKYDNFLEFIKPRLLNIHRVLKPNGSLFFHIDWRESHYCKILLDEIFGRENFINEIIWAYDYGARSKKKYSTKHDTIFWYAKNKDSYIFNFDEVERIPYMAPGLVGKEKAEKGKTLTDCWWHTIVPTNGKEKTGYPTQKPMGILRRIIKVHTNEGDSVLDCFAGSGTTGDACLELNRNFILVDSNPEAIEVMKKRFQNSKVEFNNA